METFSSVLLTPMCGVLAGDMTVWGSADEEAGEADSFLTDDACFCCWKFWTANAIKLCMSGGICLSWQAANNRDVKVSLLKNNDCAMVDEEGVTLAKFKI